MIEAVKENVDVKVNSAALLLTCQIIQIVFIILFSRKYCRTMILVDISHPYNVQQHINTIISLCVK